MKNAFTLILLLSAAVASTGQISLSKNVIVITMDGMRWQEVFSGADSLLTFDTTSTYNRKYVESRFWATSPDERRRKLMPFLWSTVVQKGMILGNRNFQNHVNNKNPYWFSYPGYNEIFTGYPDTAVNSNDKVPNRNESVFEFLSKLPEFKNKAAVFGSWDVFASIFNEERSKLMVNDGFRDVKGELTDKQKRYNELQHELPDLFHGGERLDAATFAIGFEYVKVRKPRLIHFGFGDTDEFAHAGEYDYYLDAANNNDQFIQRIWNFIQSSPQYANQTTLIITTDHGRGSAKGGNWKHHGDEIAGASEIWIAAIGPSIPVLGEAKNADQLFQGQIAATIAQIVGKKFTPDHPVLPALSLKK